MHENEAKLNRCKKLTAFRRRPLKSEKIVAGGGGMRV